ncbi:MAG: M3 family oligoendopeptidase [Sphingomonas sp.]
MLEVSRRGLMASAAAAAAASLASGVPAFAAVDSGHVPTAWDLTDLYPTDAAWDAERKAISATIPKLLRYKGKLGTSAAQLQRALQDASDLNRRATRLYVYASLKGDADLKNSANQEKRQQAQDVFTALAEATSWAGPEILKIGAPKIRGFIRSTPGLAKFRFQLEDILRQGPHTLTPEGEALLASAATPLAGPGDIRVQLVSSDIPRPTVTLSDGTKVKLDDQGYTLTRASNVRADRKLVFDNFWTSYKAFESSLGAALASQVKGEMFQAKARKYGSALEAALSGPNIPVGVYRTLVASANEGLPVLHRYFDLRRRMLGLSDMGYYDVYPPLVKLDRRFSLDEMRQLTLDALKPLGPDYQALFAKSSLKPWMDPRPRPNKQSGAYMNGSAYDVHPYLLLNLSDKYDGLTTFAHEWGHAMHTMLANSQPYELSQYPTFIAEIASTCQELLLANMMIGRAQSKEEKLFYLGQLMEQYRGTFYRQAMLAEFQLAIHDIAEKGEGLSGEKMTQTYLDLLRRYHGPRVAIDPLYATEWAYIQHFFYGFYVFQYATSITAANYFADKLLHGTDADRVRYLGVLRAGGSDYGYPILRNAGLDMASPTPYRTIIASLNNVLNQAEALLA